METRSTYGLKKRVQTKYQEAYRDIYDLLKNKAKLALCEEDESMLQEAFFRSFANIEGDDIFNNQLKETTPYVQDLVRKYSIPLKLQMLYLIVGKNNAEITFGPLQFLKLNDIVERTNSDYAMTHIIDFALIYLGMGHIIVLGMDKQTQKFFFRRDGGSSGYEREAYYHQYKDLNPSDDKYADKMYSFSEILEIIKTTPIMSYGKYGDEPEHESPYIKILSV